MKYGIQLPALGDLADPGLLIDLAKRAESAGWDGFFIWDAVIPHWPTPLLDPVVGLAAVALSTSRMRIGIMVTPLPRRRPWKYAREMTSLDHLSSGRLIAGVGIGGDPAEYDHVGDEPDARRRGDLLDDGLAIMEGLWAGAPFHHDGKHYNARFPAVTPTPVQRPRIPVWVAGQWPNMRPARRAARWDGYFPLDRDHFAFDRMMSVALTGEAIAFIRAERARLGFAPDAPYDFAHPGITPGTDPEQDAAIVAPYAAVGVTWWMEQISPWVFGWSEGDGAWPLDAMWDRVTAGPPGAEG